MWSQELYLRTLIFAGTAHKDQKVPGSEMNYVVHIVNVCNEVLLAGINTKNFDINLAMQCALLHDTLEDTNISVEELSSHFNESVVMGVCALTKNKSIQKENQMMDSLQRIKKQPKEIWSVKLADRINNLQPPPNYWNREKKEKYLEEAKLILSELKTGNEYLENRLEQKIEQYKDYL